MNKKLISLFLSTSLFFLTGCSQKPKQPTQPAIKLTQPSSLLTSPPPQEIYELEYPAPATQPPQIPEIPQSQPSQFPASQPTPSQHQPSQQIIPKPTIQTTKPNLEQILTQNYDLTKQELTTLVDQYILGLEDYQEAHKELMQEQPEEVKENYLSLEIGALNLALDTIKNPSSSQYRKIKLEQIAISYLERTRNLAPDAPIDYTSEELVEAYTDWTGLRELSLRNLLKRAIQKKKVYPTHEEMIRDNFTREDYTKLMQQHIKAIKHIKEAFLDSRTGFKGAFAKGEIKNTADFTSKFYLDTVERYFGD